MSDEFGHLFPGVRPIAALGAEERVRRIRADRWVDYPLAREALAKLEELIAFPPRARMPNLLIVGASGMGKTMIVEKFARDHPAYYDAANCVKRIPVRAGADAPNARPARRRGAASARRDESGHAGHRRDP